MTEQISQIIVRLKEDGTLMKFNERWVKRECTVPIWKTSEKLSIEFFRKLFTILAAAVSVAVAIFTSEWVMLGLSRKHDLEWMYRKSELQAMLEEDKALKKWVVPRSEQLRRRMMMQPSPSPSPKSKWRIVANNFNIDQENSNIAVDV